MRLVYICGPYRAKDPWQREQNVRRAEDLAYEVAKLGAFPVCPHSNTRPYFEGLQSDEFWLEGTMTLLDACDVLICVEGWEQSEGSKKETLHAYEEAIPVFTRLDNLKAWLED